MKLSKQKWYNRDCTLKWMKRRKKKKKRKISAKGSDGIIWVDIQRRNEKS